MSNTISPFNLDIEYRDIPGYPGYRVGSDGTVWSCLSTVAIKGVKGRVTVNDGIWREKKIVINGEVNKKRPVVKLAVNGKVKKHYVHYLVLLAFVGERPTPDSVVCHFPDPNPLNNSLSNLRYDTKKANYKDSVIHGTAAIGNRNGKAKLTEDLVRQIKLDIIQDSSYGYIQRLSKKYNIKVGTLKLLIAKQTWKHIIVEPTDQVVQSK